MKHIAVLVFGLAMAAAPPLAAVELGRLFLTPDQRAALDRARNEQPVIDPLPAPEDTFDPSALDAARPELAERLRVDGYVARSRGRETVWVNGMDSHQDNLGELGIDAAHVSVELPAVRLPVGAATNGILLKPGQTFDPNSERITDGYERQPDLAAQGSERTE